MEDHQIPYWFWQAIGLGVFFFTGQIVLMFIKSRFFQKPLEERRQGSTLIVDEKTIKDAMEWFKAHTISVQVIADGVGRQSHILEKTREKIMEDHQILTALVSMKKEQTDLLVMLSKNSRDILETTERIDQRMVS